MPDEKLDASYGIKTADAAPKAQPPGIFDPASVGAKTLQSATFGFGADAAGAVFGKQAESAIRDLEKNYDKAHPLASMGIDLAVGIAEGAATSGGSVVAGGIRGIAKGAAIGAGMGALNGAGSGGTLEERGKKAASGAVTGGLGGAALGGIGTLLKPLADRFGKMGFNGEQQAAKAIDAALKSEPKTGPDAKSIQGLESYMRQNPNGRIADYSPKVADLVGEAGSSSQGGARKLGTAIREDVSGQQSRLQTQSSPLQHVKDQMASNLKGLETQRKQAYDTAYSEITPLTPELKAALAHKDVEPLVKQSLEDFGTMRTRSGSPQSQAAKYKVGSELPTAVIDDLQKKVGAMAKDPSAIGTMRAGALQTAQSALKDAQPATLDRAQRLAASVGGEESKSGIIGAQTWGSQYAFGLGTAPIEQFRTMNPLQKQYAKLGMTDGMERYLLDKGSLGESKLRQIGDKLGKDPEIREVLGDKEANAMKKVFIKEADRMRTSTTMASGGSKRAQWKEEDMGRMLAHGANVAAGLGHISGTGVRILKQLGMPEKVATRVIDTATKPGGLAQLQKDGMSKNMLDKVAAIVSQNRVGGAATGGRVVSQENEKSER
jgi:hypothetical protein